MDDIKRILDSLSQSRVDDYKTWLEVGMALHASGESCTLWENWSRKSAKFRDGECQKRWATFGKYAGAPITIASIAKMAIDDGYNPPRASVGTTLSDTRKRGKSRIRSLKNTCRLFSNRAIL